jgi:hypothetical protein
MYAVSLLSLFCAGLLFWRGGMQLLCVARPDGLGAAAPIHERLVSLQGRSKNADQALSPLVKQATAFALYLNPPQPPLPPRPIVTAPPTVNPPPVPRPASPAPQFRLLGISYNRSDPDRSLAMVWDAGQEGRWIRKGDRLGHFVVERIEKEALIYRDGDQLRQMAVAVKELPPLGRLKSREAASMQKVAAGATLVSAAP